MSIAKLPGGAPITQARDDRSHAAYTNEARNPGVDGTNLSYVGTQPPGAPSTLMRGQVVDLGMMSSDFEVTSDLPFQIATYQVGNTIIDPSLAGKGDPSQSTVAAVEQFRKKYVFLAPNDYDVRR
ncbi:MAG: hypothetical protein ACKV2T_22135 [Kofleriaceae bacterium]